MKIFDFIHKLFFVDRLTYAFNIYPIWRENMDRKSCNLCMIDLLFKQRNLRNVTINGTTLFIRTQTSDLAVAISSLVDEEYKEIRVKEPQYILDVGANIGTSALYFNKKFPDAKIIAIEPEIDNFDILSKNTQSIENITVINAALCGTSGFRELQDRGTGSWGFTVTDVEGSATGTKQNIDCMTLCDIMSEYEIDQIDWLKMDIEGGEKEVLENAEAWIDKVNIMTVELHDRICMGCSRAFYLATQSFKKFEKNGEKVTAYKV